MTDRPSQDARLLLDGDWTRVSLTAQDLRQVQLEERAAREHLLASLDDLLAWHGEVGGCLEYGDRLRALQWARDHGEASLLDAFLGEGTLPQRMSVVKWTLRPDQATYEALLRALFEDPVPVHEDDLRKLRGATWRT